MTAPWLSLLRLLPEAPPSHALALALDRLHTRLWPDEDFGWLEGRVLRLEIAGLERGVTLAFAAGRFSASAAEPDCRVLASLPDYLRLACGREDADTLFFQRRLRVEGDVELGWRIKHLLDAAEWRMLNPAFNRQ